MPLQNISLCCYSSAKGEEKGIFSEAQPSGSLLTLRRPDAEGQSLLKQPVSPFSSAGTTLFCQGLGRPVWGTSLWCHPSPPLLQGTRGCPADSLSFSAGTGGKPGTREGSWGKGWGMAPGGRLWHPVKKAVFLRLPSLPFSLLSGSPGPQGAQARLYPRAGSGEKG